MTSLSLHNDSATAAHAHRPTTISPKIADYTIHGFGHTMGLLAQLSGPSSAEQLLRLKKRRTHQISTILLNKARQASDSNPSDF